MIFRPYPWVAMNDIELLNFIKLYPRTASVINFLLILHAITSLRRQTVKPPLYNMGVISETLTFGGKVCG